VTQRARLAPVPEFATSINNPFLSVLSEGVLNVPGLHGRGEGYVNVHPRFRAIFTSNPADPHYPTLRASIAIARVLAARGGEANGRNPIFLWACQDILRPAALKGNHAPTLSFSSF
jgi:hypothetical protein